MKGKTGFTLIELLIVVAIIAILAAIAVPNFLEAQTRARVSTVKSDLRAVYVALDAYKVDNNQIPMVARPPGDFYPTFLDIRNNPSKSQKFPGHRLTSPIAYITEIPADWFNTRALRKTSWSQWGKAVQASAVISWAPIGLQEYKGRDGWTFRVRSATGERMADFFTCTDFHAMAESTGPDQVWWDHFGNPQTDPNPFFYDPTNGTVSWGQIVWLDCGGPQAPR